MSPSAREADLLFQTEEYPDELLVIGFSGSEAISELYCFDLTLGSEDSQIDFDAIVGETAIFTIRAEGMERYVHGIVSQFELIGRGVDQTHYRARLVPAVWLLSQRRRSRIFQNKSIPDIVRQVLDDAGIASDQYRFALEGDYEELEYCVQYRETELDFISRLLERAGIHYFFEHTSDSHVMVMADSSVANVAIASPDQVVYREAAGMVPDEESVFRFQFGQQVRPGQSVLRDFNFEQPSTSLETTQTADGGRTDLEVYDHPGGYRDTDGGQTLARVRLEELRATRQVGSGDSICHRFLPGYRFTMAEHERSDLNIEYLLTRVRHRGEQPQSMSAQAGTSEETGIVYRNGA